MLRLYDERSGRVSELLGARPGRLVLWVAPTADLRGQVVADLIRRFCERLRLRVFVFTDLIATELNVRPGLSGEPPEADLSVGEISPDSPLVAGRRLEIGADAGRLPPPAQLVAEGLDPMALRLALLRRHYRETLELSADDLREATDDLRMWRSQVAGWATGPGRPMSTAYVAEAEAALGDDLDVPRALDVLRHLAQDTGVPPGAKFETFVHLDLILGLGLVSDIGR